MNFKRKSFLLPAAHFKAHHEMEKNSSWEMLRKGNSDGSVLVTSGYGSVLVTSGYGSVLVTSGKSAEPSVEGIYMQHMPH